MCFFRIKLKVTRSVDFPVFRIEVYKILHKGNSSLVEKIGFYYMHPIKRVLFVNVKRLGF